MNENFSYRMELFFLKSTDSLDTPQSLVGYISSAYTTVSVGSSSDIVNIPDNAVLAAAKLELDLFPEDDITFADLSDLSSLTVTSNAPVNLTGLQFASSLSQLTINTEQLQNIFPVSNLDQLERVKLVAPQKEGLFFTHWSDGSQENPRIIEITGSQNLALTAQYSATPLSPYAGGYSLIANGTVRSTNSMPAGLDVQVGDPYELRIHYLILEDAATGGGDRSVGMNYNNQGPAMEIDVRINEYRWVLRNTDDGVRNSSILSTSLPSIKILEFSIRDSDDDTTLDFPFSRGTDSVSFTARADLSKGELFNGPLKVPNDPGYVNWDAVTGGTINILSASPAWLISLNVIPGPDYSIRFERHPSYLNLTQRITGYATEQPTAGPDFSSENIIINCTDPYADSFETTYEVWRGTTSNPESAGLISTDPADLFHRDRNTQPGIEYFYFIRAIRDGRIADFSQSSSAVRSVNAPEDVQATQGDFSDRIRVSWTRVSGATSYSIYRSTSDDTATAELIAEGIGDNEYEDLTPDADTTYYYWVTSRAFDETSGFSVSASGYRVANGITTVRASDGLYTNRIQITWEAFPEATSYNVYRNSENNSESAITLATNIAVNQYDDLVGSDNEGVLFFYWVRPNIENVLGTLSNTDSGYIPVQRTNKILAWGDNDFDQTDIPDIDLSDIVEIAAGANHSLALRSDGTVVGWGRNEFEQSTPPDDLEDVIDIAVGYDHSLALKRDGTVEAWGRNTFGKASVPFGLANVIDVEAGAEHSLALLADGRVVAWGGNDNQQIEIPDTLDRVVQISAGGYHNLARQVGGAVVTWGDNSFGQLDIPTRITQVIDIAAGWNHSLVILPNGTVDGWGDNGRGQLDFPTDTQEPLQAKGLVIRDPVTARIVDISGGLFHSLALSAKGELSAWGETKNSQTESPESLGRVSQIDAGDEFNLIVEESAFPKIESIIPGNTTLLSGEDIVLRVRATGGPDIAFQWLFNSTPIAGAIDEALFLSDIKAAGIGSYSVKVTSGDNEISSSPIQIDVTTNQATITTQTVRAIRTYDGTYLFSPIETNPPGLSFAVRAPDNRKLPSTAGTHMISVDVEQDGYEAIPMENITLELDTLTGESLQLMETESGMTIRYLAPEGFRIMLQTSTNMRDWTTLAEVPNGDGSLHDFSLFTPKDDFYRVVFETPAPN